MSDERETGKQTPAEKALDEEAVRKVAELKQRKINEWNQNAGQVKPSETKPLKHSVGGDPQND